jgi:hypothetical protein
VTPASDPSTEAAPARLSWALPESPFAVTVVPERLRLRQGGVASFTVDIADKALREDTALIIDIYREADPTHPSGHLAWWRFVPPAGLFEASLQWDADGLSLTAQEGPAQSQWIHDELRVAGGEVLVVHVVLRSIANSRVLLDHAMLAHTADESWDAQDRVAATFGAGRGAEVPAFIWPAGVTVRVVAPSIHDIANPGRLSKAAPLAAALADLGLDVVIYSNDPTPHLRGTVRPLTRLAGDLSPTDLLVYSHEDFDPYLNWLSKLPVRKIWFSAGISLPKKLQMFDAERYKELDGARDLALLALRFERWVIHAEDDEAAFHRSLLASADVLRSQAGQRVRGLPAADRAELLRDFDDLMVAAKGKQPEASRRSRGLSPLRRPALDAVGGTEPGSRAIGDLASGRIAQIASFGLGWTLDLDVQRGSFLLWSGRMMPGERSEEIITLFGAIAPLMPELSLVIGGFSPPQSYVDYLRYWIGKQAAGFETRIDLRPELGSTEERDLFQRAGAVIWAGGHGRDTLEKARATACRTILIDPDPAELQRHGADLVIAGKAGREQAPALVRYLQSPTREPIVQQPILQEGPAAGTDELAGPALADLILDLLRQPLPERAIPRR